MRYKVMDSYGLEVISDRLSGCIALLDALRTFSETSVVSETALSGLSDLLAGIHADFQNDIAAAEDYDGKVGAA